MIIALRVALNLGLSKVASRLTDEELVFFGTERISDLQKQSIAE
jgi:hypothetical protein